MSSFGQLLRVSTFGESHGRAVGVTIDGFPSLFPVPLDYIQSQLNRRRPGQSSITTPRNEEDRVNIFSGVHEEGYTLGTPIMLLVKNLDTRPEDYQHQQKDGQEDIIIRPSHADLTYYHKYGLMAKSGGGRASARETVARVAAGTLADAWLKQKFNIEIVAWVSMVSSVSVHLTQEERWKLTRSDVDQNIIRCPNDQIALEMINVVEKARQDGDSVGAVISCVIRNAPPGLGEPVFDKLSAKLGQAMLSIPSTKGFEIGSGFSCVQMKGSEHNDPFFPSSNSTQTTIGTSKNDSGGIQGGISNGQEIYFKVAFKPPSTIGLPQNTVNFKGERVLLNNRGRHDPCVAPRAVPIVESMAALVIMDACLLQLARINHHRYISYPFHQRLPLDEIDDV